MPEASRNPGGVPGRVESWNPTLSNQLRLALYAFSLGYEEAALLTLVLPLVLSQMAPPAPAADLVRMAMMAAVLRLLGLPLAGLYSDAVRVRGGSRKPLLLAGAAADAAGLVLLLQAADLGRFAAGFWLAALGEGASLAAYQALWPERVPAGVRGAAAGYAGAASLLGAASGLAAVALLGQRGALEWMLLLVLLGALVTWGGVQEGGCAAAPRADEERAAGLRHDFQVMWLARFLVLLGVDLLMFFTFDYFRRVLGLADPAAATASTAVPAVLAAAAASLLFGSWSDRGERKRLLALAGLPMALAAAALALAPAARWLPLLALAFGVGLGAFLAVDWALGVETLPDGLHLARDLGLRGLAAGLPLLLAPGLGGTLLALGGGEAARGYRLLFLGSGLALAAGSLVALRVGARPLSPLRWLPVRLLAAVVVPVYLALTCRVVVEGRLQRRRGATLVVVNHQHDLDSLVVAGHLMRSGPFRDPVFSAGSQRMFEPGFLAGRAPRWLEPFLRRADWSGLFRALGIRPVENQPLSRPLRSLALEVMRRHGPLPLGEVLRPEALGRLAQAAGLPPAELRGLPLGRLWEARLFHASGMELSAAALAEPFRSEVRRATRARIERQLADLEHLLRRGATFYLTPEGRFSEDGRLGRMRASLERLLPLAESVWVAAVSYEPYAGRRLGVFVRLRRLEPGERPERALAAARPVTMTQLLATWLLERDRRGAGDGVGAGQGEPAAFSEAEALAGVAACLEALPEGLLLAPPLRRGLGRPLRAALAAMVRRGALRRRGACYLPGPVRRHPRFLHVEDMLAYQAGQLAESVAACAGPRGGRLAGSGLAGLPDPSGRGG